MTDMSSSPPSLASNPLGPFRPTLIIHGGAGVIPRAHLPPSLYTQYYTTLLNLLKTTRSLLDNGHTALDAAVHAVSLLEDCPLFNCGRGSVFTSDGTIEMEASLMVASVLEGKAAGKGREEGHVKRTAAVSMIRNTRNPIKLAREVLLQGDEDEGFGGVGTMHGHLNGRNVEEWGWKRGVERKEDAWFWTKRRWEEHRRGLGKGTARGREVEEGGIPSGSCEDEEPEEEEQDLPSQGTVGCVTMDSWGNLCVATSTGGLTNKRPGRIGDTPTVGSGYFAGSWNEEEHEGIARGDAVTWLEQLKGLAVRTASESGILQSLGSCLPIVVPSRTYSTLPRSFQDEEAVLDSLRCLDEKNAYHPTVQSTDDISNSATLLPKQPRRAIAVSGTGNGDSFLRTAAAHTVVALCQYSHSTLETAVTSVAGPDGILQHSAGDRSGKTGEGEGGIIGIEVISDHNQKETKVVFDFNCGGMWRAWFEKDKYGGERPRIMVFRDEYR